MTDGGGQLPEAPDEPIRKENKSPWNSLEIWKLVLAGLTPIAIFLLGLFVTLYSHKREDQIRDQARAEARLNAKEARLAEIRLRDENRREQQRIRTDAVETERALRAEGAVVEAALRRESDARAAAVQRDSDAREAMLRREAGQQVRSNRILDKRIETWARAAPQLRRFNERMFELYRMVLQRHQAPASANVAAGFEAAIRETWAARDEVEELIVPFQAFFSDAFNRAQSCFFSNSGLLLNQLHAIHLAAPDADLEPLYAAWSAMEDAYGALTVRASLELREEAVLRDPIGRIERCPSTQALTR